MSSSWVQQVLQQERQPRPTCSGSSLEYSLMASGYLVSVYHKQRLFILFRVTVFHSHYHYHSTGIITSLNHKTTMPSSCSLLSFRLSSPYPLPHIRHYHQCICVNHRLIHSYSTWCTLCNISALSLCATIWVVAECLDFYVVTMPGW